MPKKIAEIIKKSSFLFYMNKKKAVPVLLNAYEPRIRQKMGRVFSIPEKNMVTFAYG